MPITSLLADPNAPSPLIAASILSADFSRMGAQCREVLEAGADLLHLDVMDGHFVPNLTMGPAMCRSLRKLFPQLCLDVHLMVTDPAMFVQPFADAGASNLTFHIEAVANPSALVSDIRQAGMTAGVAINPTTDASSIRPFLDEFDVILIMSVNPGFAGQSFIPNVLDKASALKRLLRPDQRLEIDGGVSAENAEQCRSAGCDVLVAASAIFNAPDQDYATAIARLRGR